MDRYGLEPDYGDTVYLEEEPLMPTSEFEIMSYPGEDETDHAL